MNTLAKTQNAKFYKKIVNYISSYGSWNRCFYVKYLGQYEMDLHQASGAELCGNAFLCSQPIIKPHQMIKKPYYYVCRQNRGLHNFCVVYYNKMSPTKNFKHSHMIRANQIKTINFLHSHSMFQHNP